MQVGTWFRPVARVARRFRKDTAGSLVVWFTVALIPLLFALGAGLDYGRTVNLNNQLQGAADAAALAGATVYVSAATATTATAVATTYMNNFIAAMGTTNGITFTVATSAKASGTTATLYAVTVTAKGTLSNSIMALSRSTNGASVTSTASNPVYTITLTLSSYTSSAADADTIYYYVVPSDGSVPAATALNQFFTNSSSSSMNAVTVQLTASQKLGFALKNITGGKSYYARNGYGSRYLTVNWLYSHLMPPSSQAYSTSLVSKNCALQVTTSLSAVTMGSCLSALPTYAAVNCATASGKTLIYSWNDMGGGSDDLDYNDMVYTVKCSQNDTSLGTGVVLTN